MVQTRPFPREAPWYALCFSFGARGKKTYKKGARMQLILVFEILLLVAIVAGIFVGWDRPAQKDRERLRNRGQSPI